MPREAPAALTREWREKLRASGFRDIEYDGGMLLGLSLQNPERAPDEVDVHSTREYFSRCGEFLHARRWRGEGAARRAWAAYCEGVPLRDIAEQQGLALTTLHRLVDRLRAECAEWWEATREARENPPPERGRPRKENPRRLRLVLRLTLEEQRAIEAAARRAAAGRSHGARAWVRMVLLQAAQSVPFGPSRVRE